MSVVRVAEQERDAAACAAIYAPYVTDSPASFETVAPDADQMAARIRHAISWLVLEDADGTVGYAYATSHRDRSAYRWAADVSVYLHEGVHRRGGGRALYKALLAELVDRGVLVACAGITLPNAASVGLHEALGFKRVGVYEQIGFKAGAWHDVGWWQLRLGPASGRPAEPRLAL